MRKVVVSEFVSLDGVMEDPAWTFHFSSQEQERFKLDEQLDELSAGDALLLGRVTYEGFAAAWPRMMEQYRGPCREDIAEYTSMMNGSQIRRVHDPRLMVFPVVLGGGKRLFREGVEQKALTHVATKALSSGVVVLGYEPARDE